MRWSAERSMWWLPGSAPEPSASTTQIGRAVPTNSREPSFLSTPVLRHSTLRLLRRVPYLLESAAGTDDIVPLAVGVEVVFWAAGWPRGSSDTIKKHDSAGCPRATVSSTAGAGEAGQTRNPRSTGAAAGAGEAGQTRNPRPTGAAAGAGEAGQTRNPRPTGAGNPLVARRPAVSHHNAAPRSDGAPAV